MSLENANQAQAFKTVISLLTEFLEPTTVPKWLFGTNAHLAHRRPIDLLLSGRLPEVISAIENERNGTFA